MRAAPRLDGRAAQVDAVDGDAPGGRLVEAAEQLDQGGLAGAVLAHDARGSAGGDGEVEGAKTRVIAPG